MTTVASVECDLGSIDLHLTEHGLPVGREVDVQGEPAAGERQHPALLDARGAHGQRRRDVDVRVAHQLGELDVDPTELDGGPGELLGGRGAGLGRVEGPAERRLQHVIVVEVAAGHHPASRNGRSSGVLRSEPRHRWRVGPMLPWGMPVISEMAS